MTTKQTETMTDIQAFNRRFENLDGWGIRINGLDGRLVEIDEYDDDCELSTQGHFTYVSHDADGVTVEVGLPDRDPYKEAVIPFAADGDEVERLLMGAIRECEKAEEALTAPETMTITQAFRKRFDTPEMRANGVEVDDDYSASVYELTLDGRKAIGGFASVSHDEASITVEVARSDEHWSHPPKDVTIPFSVSDDTAFWQLKSALREPATGETLAAPESAAAAGAWGPDALQGEKPEAAVRRLRDGLSAPVTPPKPPEVETRCVLLESTEGIIQAHNDGYTVAGKKGIWVVFYRLIKED